MAQSYRRVPVAGSGTDAARRSRVKPRLVGSTEESIPISQVAPVSISTGLIWADIRIDSSGGSNPILSHGRRKGDARRIRDLIEGYQKNA